MTDEPVDDESAEIDVSGWLRVLDRRTPVTTGWRSGDVVRRTAVRRRRRQVLFGGTATAIVAAVALTLAVTAGNGGGPATVHVALVPGTHVGARIDGAVQLVSDSHTSPPTDGPVAQVVRAQQRLAIELLRRLGTGDGNVSVSPTSLQLALGMLQNGARGTTRTQIARALQTPGLTTAQQNAGLATLKGRLSAAASHDHLALDSANSLWQQQGFRLRRQFLAAIAPYGAGVWQTDFATDQGLDAINRWTDQHTHGKITKLFDQLDPSTVLVIANALYLHANWATPFEKNETAVAPFTTADGHRVSAHFMTGADGLATSTTADYDAIQLPYRGGRFAALAVMPKQSLSAFVAGLTPARITAIATEGYSTSSGIALPRLTTRTSSNLVPTLRALGMRQVFTPSADLSGIGTGGLHVGKVVQRVYLHLDEKGTTAAAATGVAVTAGATVGPSIRFDHPFLFLVRDTVTGAILFASEINDPTAG